LYNYIHDEPHVFGGFVDYANKLKDCLYWWLGKSKPFIINNEYKLELLFVDKINNSAKIRVTNLKTGVAVESSAEQSAEVVDGQE
jgi:hypothetical protein